MALLALLGAARPLVAQQPGLGGVSRALANLMRVDSVVGGAAVLVRDGRIVQHVELGYGDRARGVRMASGSIFHWASITKTLTAVAIMQLRDRGRLSLDDPITRWVPELEQVHNPFGPMDRVTIRMLLSHSSGFQNPTWPYRQYAPWEPFEPTRWEQLVAMMPYQEIQFSPGSRFGYSNPAYIYLARVIETITGDPYQSYIYKNIWVPLGMTRSYFGTTPEYLATDRSHNYTAVRDSAGVVTVRDNGPDFDPGVTIPNGGWNAPLEDLAKWMACLSGATAGDLARGRIYEAVVRRETLTEMWRPVVPDGPDGSSVGLGFFLRPAGRDTLVYHSGEQAGFRSVFMINPRTRLAVVAVVNSTDEANPVQSEQAFKELVDAMGRLLGP